jgi:hypothetical protein
MAEARTSHCASLRWQSRPVRPHSFDVYRGRISCAEGEPCPRASRGAHSAKTIEQPQSGTAAALGLTNSPCWTDNPPDTLLAGPDRCSSACVFSSPHWRRAAHCPRSILSRGCRSRRADELWTQQHRACPPSRRLYRSRPWERSQSTCQSCGRASSSWSSISRPPRRWASTYRSIFSRSPTK